MFKKACILFNTLLLITSLQAQEIVQKLSLYDLLDSLPAELRAYILHLVQKKEAQQYNRESNTFLFIEKLPIKNYWTVEKTNEKKKRDDQPYALIYHHDTHAHKYPSTITSPNLRILGPNMRGIFIVKDSSDLTNNKLKDFFYYFGSPNSLLNSGGSITNDSLHILNFKSERWLSREKSKNTFIATKRYHWNTIALRLEELSREWNICLASLNPACSYEMGPETLISIRSDKEEIHIALEKDSQFENQNPKSSPYFSYCLKDLFSKIRARYNWEDNIPLTIKAQPHYSSNYPDTLLITADIKRPKASLFAMTTIPSIIEGQWCGIFSFSQKKCLYEWFHTDQENIEETQWAYQENSCKPEKAYKQQPYRNYVHLQKSSNPSLLASLLLVEAAYDWLESKSKDSLQGKLILQKLEEDEKNNKPLEKCLNKYQAHYHVLQKKFNAILGSQKFF